MTLRDFIVPLPPAIGAVVPEIWLCRSIKTCNYCELSKGDCLVVVDGMCEEREIEWCYGEAVQRAFRWAFPFRQSVEQQGHVRGHLLLRKRGVDPGDWRDHYEDGFFFYLVECCRSYEL